MTIVTANWTKDDYYYDKKLGKWINLEEYYGEEEIDEKSKRLLTFEDYIGDIE